MLKKSSLILLIALLTGLFLQAQTDVAFVSREKPKKSQKEIREAWALIDGQKSIDAKYLPPKKLSKLRKLEKFEVIWIHLPDSTQGPEEVFTPEQIKNLKTYVASGGQLFLTREAAFLPYLMGIESNKPSVVNKNAKDMGYGRMLGFHGFRSHPVFAGLNGGAYILKPSEDIRVRNIGYFHDEIPSEGTVVATDWDYIFLREHIKLVTEYTVGKGKIIAAGAYMHFKYPDKQSAGNEEIYNVNRLHLEKFTLNCIDYLLGKTSGTEIHYWNFSEPEITKMDPSGIKYFPSMRQQKAARPWEIAETPMDLSRRYATGNFWDVAGERLLIMGKEQSGIDEIWSHPFMAFRDYEVGIRFSYNDSIIWLNDQRPMITVSPTHFKRQYQFRRAFLTEIITVSPDQPQAVIHYEYRGVYPAELFIRFKSNQRLMWPYSGDVLGGMNYTFHQKLNAYVLTDPSGDFVSVMGFNKELHPVYFSDSPLLPAIRKENHPIGPFDSITAKDSVWHAAPAKGILVSGLAHLRLDMNDNLDVIVAAGNEGVEKSVSAYQQALHDPEKIYKNALDYHADLKKEKLQLISPDSVFNLAFNWAIEGSDRFFVHTPGLGKSLHAGYATTDWGWDGKHKVSGRPGYSWYFGRDSEWSGMALLHYGDFEKVRSILLMLQDFQDLNGKILHELSTSGFVHYDASDATPLYLVLAGRYLKHSGDTGFIRNSWSHIKSAMDFMYSTDTDGDGLIENTNVGHGWVEGGSLFGSHTSLYLAACWAEALENAACIAQNLDKTALAEKYAEDAKKVVELINTKYWNEDDEFYYHGLKQDGSFITEKTIMQSIPVLFGQTEKNRGESITKSFAGNNFTSDWGVRIVGENSELFSPKGYHTGSVWPLYTGWTALAEYKAGRHVQGFTHFMNNMQVYQHWALGFIEEVMHGLEYKPSGVCRHQCWSETMALQPLIEGMAGLDPDAPAGELNFSPAFPAHWDSVAVRNIRVGEHFIDLVQIRSNGTIRYHFSKKTPGSLKINFSPYLPDGTEVITKSLDGKLQRPNPGNPKFSFNLSDTKTIEINTRGGIEILPSVPEPKPGYESKGFRILDHRLEKNVYTIELEARTGARETFRVFLSDWKTVKIEKAEIIEKQENVFTFSVDFPEVDSKYARQTVKIYLDQ